MRQGGAGQQRETAVVQLVVGFADIMDIMHTAFLLVAAHPGRLRRDAGTRAARGAVRKREAPAPGAVVAGRRE